MKRQLLIGLAAGLLVGAVVTAWAQVYPPRWEDSPEPVTRALSADTVALDDGAVILSVDNSTSTASPGFAPGAYRESSCTLEERGEIRLWSITFTAATPDVISDALCFCQQRQVAGSPATYRWVCINTSVD